VSGTQKTGTVVPVFAFIAFVAHVHGHRGSGVPTSHNYETASGAMAQPAVPLRRAAADEQIHTFDPHALAPGQIMQTALGITAEAVADGENIRNETSRGSSSVCVAINGEEKDGDQISSAFTKQWAWRGLSTFSPSPREKPRLRASCCPCIPNQIRYSPRVWGSNWLR